VAIAVRDGRAVGYVCDGEEVEAWLEDTLEGAELSPSGADGGSTVTATVTEEATVGTLTVDDPAMGEQTTVRVPGPRGPTPRPRPYPAGRFGTGAPGAPAGRRLDLRLSSCRARTGRCAASTGRGRRRATRCAAR
jgi:hypothetical protein